MGGGVDGLLLLSCREARGCPHQASYEYIFPAGVYFVLHKSAGTLSTSSTPRYSVRVDYGWDLAAVDRVDTRIGPGYRLRYICEYSCRVQG